MSKFQHDVMLRVVKILNVLMIELPFAACWFLYYSHQTYANLAWEGHFAILGLFFILYIVLGKISNTLHIATMPKLYLGFLL